MTGKGLFALALAGCSLAGFTGCAPLGDENSPSAHSAGATVAKISPSPDFVPDGVATEWIEVGDRRIQLPEGIRLPDGARITSANEATVMIAEEDPEQVLDAVTASAEAAGYEVVAEPHAGCRLWVGRGNAVLLDTTAGAQILSWAPESMKDVLAQG